MMNAVDYSSLIRKLLYFLSLVCLLSQVSVIHASEIEKPVCFPLGVADANGKIGYLLNFASGIDAIDLGSGQLLWKTSIASRPLIAFDDLLVAGAVGNRPNVLTVSVLDASRTGEIKIQASVEFPQWVTVYPFDGPAFAIKASLQRSNRKCELLLEWRARSRYTGGANPPPFIEKRDRKDAAGKVSIDLKTGTVIKMSAKEIIDAPQERTPSPDKKLLALISEQGVEQACLIGQRIYYLVEGRRDECILKAKALNSGQVLWAHTLSCQRNSRPPALRQ